MIGKRPGLALETRQHAARQLPGRVLSRSGVLAPVVLFLLACVVVGETAAAWRYFPSFMADQGWYLQVARRVSQGDRLYRDVAWAYGPLPAQVMAALFRWFGPQADLATLLNGFLAGCSVLLSYTLLRGLLRTRHALLLILYAALAGTSVGGDLIHLHLYTYTQANAWGSVAGLAALAAALRWQRTARRGWLLVSGLAAGLAVLSKPEFGLVALAALAVLLATARAGVRSWVSFGGTCAMAVLAGFAWQASDAGWEAVWRGYRGYDQLSAGNVWGLAPGSVRWVAGVYGFWMAAVLGWLAGQRTRGRKPALAAAVFAGLIGCLMLLSDLVAGSGQEALALLRSRDLLSVRPAPAMLLAWLAAAPWGPLFFILLLAGWLGRRRAAPAAFWGLWTFAALSNLRYVLTGYANGFAVAPALAVLWWLAVVDRRGIGLSSVAAKLQSVAARLPAVWAALVARLARPAGLAAMALAVLATANVGAQYLGDGIYFRQPRVALDTALGPVTMGEATGGQVLAVQTLLAQPVWRDHRLFATNWGGGWYLVADRPNPTAFDVVMDGLGTSGGEADVLRTALVRNPPAVIITPDWMWDADTRSLSPRRARNVRAVQVGLDFLWAEVSSQFRDETPANVSDWRVLVRH